ncbi:DNA primase [Rhabdochromatium marinum]|uniref:DNA primase n=1 Tax=Rhabdochromatium marinum TaxID=48729 RepID=UPI001904F094|nr:DNA primase [Rhabdochromatium marinum]MBK1647648.1 DNA primase [Rhabdochromatium marinum]
MVGRITPELKEQILARTDILEIVGARVPLRQAGQLYKSCCPFHQEKTPSFTVTPARQSYHCFGCGAHGNAIDFLIEYDRLSYPEAMAELAHRAGMLLPEAGTDQEAAPPVDLSPLYRILAEAAALYQQQLRDNPQAVAYLKGRGLSGAMAAEFRLGFAPPGWDFLLGRLGRDPDQQQRLIEAGLVIERTKEGETRRYDRFRHRIIFPIRDQRGRIIAFGGRVLDQSEPKYLNSPETAVFHKGHELYGLYEARQRQHQMPRLLLVEGYLDVIALTQFGLPYAVATLGTATTPEQLQRLKRHTDELVFCFDGDQAGQAAAWKALRISLPLVSERLSIRFLLLPSGYDPDSLLRAQGRAAFEARLEQAQLLSDFLFDGLRERAQLESAEGRARCDAEARKLIALAPEGTYQQLLLQRLESLVGIQRSSSTAAMPGVPATFARSSQRPPYARPLQGARTHPVPVRPQLTPVRLATALLLQRPQLALAARAMPEHWTSLAVEGRELLSELLAQADADPAMTPAKLLEQCRHCEQEPLMAELADPETTQHIPAEGMEAEFIGALSVLNRQAEREQRYQWLSRGDLECLSAKPQQALTP